MSTDEAILRAYRAGVADTMIASQDRSAPKPNAERYLSKLKERPLVARFSTPFGKPVRHIEEPRRLRDLP